MNGRWEKDPLKIGEMRQINAGRQVLRRLEGLDGWMHGGRFQVLSAQPKLRSVNALTGGDKSVALQRDMNSANGVWYHLFRLEKFVKYQKSWIDE